MKTIAIFTAVFQLLGAETGLKYGEPITISNFGSAAKSSCKSANHVMLHNTKEDVSAKNREYQEQSVRNSLGQNLHSFARENAMTLKVVSWECGNIPLRVASKDN